MLSKTYLAVLVPVDPVKNLPWPGRYFPPLKHTVTISVPCMERTFLWTDLHRIGKRSDGNSAHEQKGQRTAAKDGSTHLNSDSARFRTASLSHGLAGEDVSRRTSGIEIIFGVV